MALQPCPECGREISGKARVCPHCGHPLREPRVPVNSTSIGCLLGCAPLIAFLVLGFVFPKQVGWLLEHLGATIQWLVHSLAKVYEWMD